MKRSWTLVTGGAGFIGSNLVRRLVGMGRNVSVIDDLSSGRMTNLMGVVRKTRFVKGDINDAVALKEALKGVDVVFHIAAIPSVPRSVAQPLEITRANVQGTVQLLDFCARGGVRRLVFASSSSVYGDTPTLPKRENLTPNPLSPYAASKLSCEYYCETFQELYPLETVCLRFFNVFGPRQDPTSQYAAAIPIFVGKLLAGAPIPVYGDGNQTRDFTFVEDIVDGLLLASRAKGAAGKVINLAAGRKTTVNEMIDVIADILGRKADKQFLPRREGDIIHSYADIGRARRILKFRSRWSLKEGLKQTVAWFRNEEDIGNALYRVTGPLSPKSR